MQKKDDPAALRQEIRRPRTIIAELGPNLDSLLRQRGFKVYKKEPADDLILPVPCFIDRFYEIIKKYSFRIFLRDVVKHQDGFQIKDVSRYTTTEVAREYIARLLDTGLIEPHDKNSFQLVKRPITSFGATLEWFPAETFKREFGTEAVWGVKFRRPGTGGDYDLLARINGSILYMEIKSSPPKQIHAKEIAAFLDRADELNPALSIYLMDTELRMKDKMVPLFEDQLKLRSSAPPAVNRMVRELFEIDNRIFIINAKGGIAANIEKVLGWFFRHESPD